MAKSTTETRKGAQSAPTPHKGAASKAATVIDRIVESVLGSLNAVVLTRRNIEEVIEDAVRRGRMTQNDAQEMLQSLLSLGARATDDVLADIQRLLGRAGQQLEPRGRETRSKSRRPPRASLPIANYDELSAAQVQERLGGLTSAQLRKVRDYERGHANRKTVLDPIERKLR